MAALVVLLLCFAEVVNDPLSGGAGWIGAGLLGLVLGWLLLIHLPAKDKQLKEFMEAKDKIFREYVQVKDTQLDIVMGRKWEAIDKMTREFSADLKIVTEHCEKEVEAAVIRHAQQLGVFRELSDSVRLMIQQAQQVKA